MAKTLDNIISEVRSTDLTEGTTSLKGLKDALVTATENYEKAEADKKAEEKTKLDAAQKGYDEKRISIINLVKTKIDAAAEDSTLAVYSKEVAERRKARKASAIEEEINSVQGQIDIHSLDIADIDKEIEEKRKAFAPDKAA